MMTVVMLTLVMFDVRKKRDEPGGDDDVDGDDDHVDGGDVDGGDL